MLQSCATSGWFISKQYLYSVKPINYACLNVLEIWNRHLNIDESLANDEVCVYAWRKTFGKL